MITDAGAAQFLDFIADDALRIRFLALGITWPATIEERLIASARISAEADRICELPEQTPFALLRGGEQIMLGKMDRRVELRPGDRIELTLWVHE